MKAEGLAHVRFERLDFEYNYASFVRAGNTRDVRFSGCRFSNGAACGLSIHGSENRVTSCDFSQLGTQGIICDGGDRKTLTLAADAATTVTMEVDVTGWGVWVKAGEYALKAGESRTESLSRALGGYWVRFVSDHEATVLALLAYE